MWGGLTDNASLRDQSLTNILHTNQTEGNDIYLVHNTLVYDIENTHYLNYTQVWVELALQSGRYYMLSAPLKDMFAGDIFIPASMNGTQNNDHFM